MFHIQAQSSHEKSSDQRNENHLISSPQDKIFILADGFGGSGSGEGGAASLACESILQFLVHEAGDREATLPFVMRNYFSLAGNVLFNSLIFANRVLLTANAEKSVHERGGASVIAGFLDEGILSVASVGSCVGWFFREGRRSPLLVPRSWGRLVDPAASIQEVASQLPLMSLGVSEELEPEVVDLRVRQGDRVWFGNFEPSSSELDDLAVGGGITSFSKNPLSSIGYSFERSWVLWEI